MKISTQTIKFINEHHGSAGDPAQHGVEDLVLKIGAQLGAVEDTVDFGSRYEPVVVVRIVSCEDHPNADRLHVCKVDDGGKAGGGVERDENGHVQVVCGAPNIRIGMLAAWLPPGATVPSTVGGDPFVLEARDFRGVLSNGMMASPKELGLSDWHEGILEVTEDFGEIAPGTSFADVYHLRGDVIIDMENKMFTHRPDCFGWLGIARELEGIHQRPYKSPEWYRMHPDFPEREADELKLEVRNELPELVPRFTAIVMSNIEVKNSPVWLQVDLARAGLRPINNIVDYTNLYMLETGQPLHAYDYDKVKALSEGDQATIVVRHPKEGEKITLLNGKEVEPRDEAIMIATDRQAIGIGGVMGGGDTEVDEGTKNIIIECANFNMYSIRRTSMAHGLFTDAVSRFNKGQSPLQNLAVLGKIVQEIHDFAGGKVAGPLVDINHVSAAAQERGSVHAPVTVSRQFINERLGWDLSVDDIARLLENVECTVDKNGDNLTVKAPFWRTDIEIAEDVVEEVGRLYGYDHLALSLPRREIVPAPQDPLVTLKAKIRQILAEAGANEILSYSFVHGNLLDKVGQDKQQAYRLSNALSPDLQYMRLSLMPSLLERVHPNIKAGYDQFALFEINKVHSKTLVDDEGLPAEFTRTALVFAAEDKTAAGQYSGAPYYQARKYAVALLASAGLMGAVRFAPLSGADFGGHSDVEQMTKPFEPNRSAVVMLDNEIIGVVGEYRRAVAKALKLPAFAAGFELFVRALVVPRVNTYVQLPRFPKIEQDLCLRVPSATNYQAVYDFVWQHLDQHRPDATYSTLAPVDIYQRDTDAAGKQITLRIGLASYERTLTDAEVATMLDAIAAAAKADLQAERV